MTKKQNNTNFKSLATRFKENKPLKIAVFVLVIMLSIALILSAVFSILDRIGKKSFTQNAGAFADNPEFHVSEDIIIYEGAKYKLKENVISMLFLGIDNVSKNEYSEIGRNGQADTIFVGCIDTETKSIKIIPISRETMADIDVYTTDGKFAGTENKQICLSYAYGNNAETGCENVKNSVNRFLGGIEIDSYIALDFNAIPPLSRAVGGVEVISIETIGEFVEGKKVTLYGDNANAYVRKRGDDVNANNRRFERQKQFLTAFASKAGNEILKNITKIASLYKTASPYITTNLDLSEITYLTKLCLTKNIGNTFEYIPIEGETVMGKELVEFNADINSVYEAVLKAFYDKFN